MSIRRVNYDLNTNDYINSGYTIIRFNPSHTYMA